MLLALLAVPAGGCAFKGGPQVTGPAGGQAGGEVWQPRPLSMRLFPSSGLSTVQGQPVLAARVELLDEMGDSLKAAGHFRFELYAGGRPNQPSLEQRLYTWDVPMVSLPQNRTYYDPITRAYLFNLILQEPLDPSRPITLAVAFLPALEGQRLQTTAVFEEGRTYPTTPPPPLD